MTKHENFSHKHDYSFFYLFSSLSIFQFLSIYISCRILFILYCCKYYELIFIHCLVLLAGCCVLYVVVFNMYIFSGFNILLFSYVFFDGDGKSFNSDDGCAFQQTLVLN